MADAWPTELRLDKDKRVLTVTFDDGLSFALPAELLRVLSPSAEVQGHSEAQRVTVGGKKNVGIVRLELVGNYAVRIVFDSPPSASRAELRTSPRARAERACAPPRRYNQSVTRPTPRRGGRGSPRRCG
jgi:hypothetical protein